MTPKHATQVGEQIVSSVFENGFVITFAIVMLLLCIAFAIMTIFAFYKLFIGDKGLIPQAFAKHKEHVDKLDDNTERLVATSEQTVRLLQEHKEEAEERKQEIVEKISRTDGKIITLLKETQDLRLDVAKIKCAE